MGKDLKTLYKRKTPTADTHMKRCSTSLVTRKTQFGTTARYYYTPIRMAKVQKLTIPSAKRGAERLLLV